MTKGAVKTLLVVALACGSMLLYVHGQLALLRVSYGIDASSQALSKKTDMYRQLKFEVDRLKAPTRLEAKIKEYDLDLQLPKDIELIRIPTVTTLPAQTVQRASFAPSDRLFNLLGRWINVAQAKTER